MANFEFYGGVLSKRTYKIFGICFYLLLIIVLGLCTGAKLYRFYFSSPAVEDLDMSGYDILNVNRIKGNPGPVLLGIEDTSHAVTGSGSIVFDKGEANGAFYCDSVLSVAGTLTATGNLSAYYGQYSLVSSYFLTKDNIEHVFGTGENSFIGWDSLELKLRIGNGSDCTTYANVALEVNKSTDVAVINNLSVGGDLTVTGEIIGGTKSYAEMYRCCYNSVTTIDTADFWHMVSTTTVGLLNNWTHEVGDTAAITAYADGGGGLVTVTSAGHGMSAGNMISITGSTNYNALEEVVGVHTDTFTVTAAWAGDDAAGTWIKGDSLTAGANSAGVYAINFTATLTPAVNNEIFSFAFSKNAVECEKCRVRNKMGIVGDYKPEPGASLISIAEGDVLNFIVKNVGANGNVTIRHGNINLHRL